MRGLADTQVMLWWLFEDSRLGAESRELLASWRFPLIFRDQNIEADADLLPVLDSAGQRHRASRR